MWFLVNFYIYLCVFVCVFIFYFVVFLFVLIVFLLLKGEYFFLVLKKVIWVVYYVIMGLIFNCFNWFWFKLVFFLEGIIFYCLYFKLYGNKKKCVVCISYNGSMIWRVYFFIVEVWCYISLFYFFGRYICSI